MVAVVIVVVAVVVGALTVDCVLFVGEVIALLVLLEAVFELVDVMIFVKSSSFSESRVTLMPRVR